MFVCLCVRYGQECCYSDSTLVTGSPAGGSVDSISQEVNVWGHIREDIIPYTHCCLGPQSNCLEYYKYRPSDNGARYSPDPPGQFVQILVQLICSSWRGEGHSQNSYKKPSNNFSSCLGDYVFAESLPEMAQDYIHL